jgi:cytochrome c oxidase subunit II
MKLSVVAEPAEAFKSWLRSQSQSAVIPTTDNEKRGYAVFMNLTCIMCHNISGTPASGTTAPDLSHLASRPKIAGYSLENTRENLARWIVDPQHFKPGVRMPQHNLALEDVNALVDYLESLQ